MSNGGRFQPGQSGNPKGRPPKHRALAAILEKAGAKTVEVPQPDGTTKKISGKRLLAQMLWEVATVGRVTLPDGKEQVVDDFNDWLACVKFIYTHIDGPARTEIDLDLGAMDIMITMDR